MTASVEKIIGRLLAGKRVLLPGPGHSEDDRSVSVWPAPNDDGFTVKSFSGDDRQACIEHVKSLLDQEKRAALAAMGADLPARDDQDARERADPLAPGWYGRWTTAKAVPAGGESGPRAADERRRSIARAVEIWDESVSPIGTIVETYLWQRHLDLDEDIAGDVIRYHPQLPWKDELTGKVFRTNAMVCALRDIRSDEIVGVSCTRLSAVGEKLDRRFRGISAGAAIMFDGFDSVTMGLAICEGAETGLSARQLGLRPVWACGSAGEIAKFPVLGGIECLTILAENDDASAKATEACGDRWHAAGREMRINRPIAGKDVNDALRGSK
jgi:putative DNA primase/helicase